MRVLALDFDGVIANSQYECFVVGFNSYLRLNKNTKLLSGKKITFDNFNKIKRKYKKTIEQYKKLRPYVIDGFCWYVIFYIIENSIKIKNQNQFNKVRKKLMRKFYDKYIKYFYNERYLLQKENFSKWLKLEVPFKKIINTIKKLEKSYTITIATNNNRKSIQGLLKKHKIKPKVIADIRISINKKKQIEYIKNKLKVKFTDIYFVDDQIKNFPKLLKLNVHCFLALWGYNNKKQQNEAKKSGVIMLNQNNFYKTLA